MNQRDSAKIKLFSPHIVWCHDFHVYIRKTWHFFVKTRRAHDAGKGEKETEFVRRKSETSSSGGRFFIFISGMNDIFETICSVKRSAVSFFPSL